MQEEIKEYGEALESHLNALKNEVTVKDEVRKSYHRLMKAREIMRYKEHEIIEEFNRIK